MVLGGSRSLESRLTGFPGTEERMKKVKTNGIKALSALAAIASLLAIVWLPRMLSSARPMTTDDDDVRAVVEAAINLELAACLSPNHGQEATFKSQAATYWSSQDLQGDPLATSQAAWIRTFATPGPGVVQSMREDAVARHASGASSTNAFATAVVMSVPTPWYQPADSPLDMTSHFIDNCQSWHNVSGASLYQDAGIESIDFEQLVIDGGVADVVARVVAWRDRINLTSPGGVTRYTENQIYTFTLMNSGGRWLILNEDMTLDEDL